MNRVLAVPVCAFVLLVSPLCAGGGPGNQPHASLQHPGMMTRPEFRAYIGSVQTNLAQWKSQLDGINASGIGREVGMEEPLSTARKQLALCERFASRLATSETLGDDAGLFMTLQRLEMSILFVWTVLDEASEQAHTHSAAQAKKFADRLTPANEQIGADSLKLYEHFQSLAEIADTSCPALEAHLHP